MSVSTRSINNENGVYDPRGIVDIFQLKLASRVGALDGLTLGILDNSKWNANKLLRGASTVLNELHDFRATNYYVKHSFSKDANPELISQIAEECDVVLTAIGDCGSCTSACVRDAIALEKLGVPSAAIVTTEFAHETKLTREALGMSKLQPVIIEHPVSSITQAEVESRVAEIRAGAEKVWLEASS